MNLKKISKTDRYGNSFTLELYEPPESGVPEMPSVSMIAIPEMDSGMGMDSANMNSHPGGPKGTDTVPAWLTPGENVVNAEASRIPGNQQIIDQMNQEGREIQEMQGGPIPSMEGVNDVPSMEEPVYASTGMNFRDWIKSKEGWKNNAYQDVAGNWTIGAGSTTDVAPGMNISNEEAEERLSRDIAKVNQDYSRLVTNKNLNNNQQMAVKSLLFNIGPTQFGSSKALQALNAGDYPTFLREAKEFRMAGGKVVQGLVNRRASEFGPDGLFNKPIPTVNYASSDNSGWSLFPKAQAATLTDSDKKAQEHDSIWGYEGERKDPDARKETNQYLKDEGSSWWNPYGIFDKTISDIEKEKLKNQRKRAKEGFEENAFPAFNPKTGDTWGVDWDWLNWNTPWFRDGLNEIESRLNELNTKMNKKGYIPKERDIKNLEELTKKKAELIKRIEDQKKWKEEINKPTEEEIKLKEKIKTIQEEAGLETTEETTEEVKVNTDIVSKLLSKTKDAPKVDDKKIKDNESEANEWANKNPTLFEEIKAELSHYFPKRELVRAGLSYLGSRLLGYSHSSSLDFVGKDYLKRVDAGIAAKEKWARSKQVMENFDAKSVTNFLDSLDYDDLIPLKKAKYSGISKTAMWDKYAQEKVSGILGPDGKKVTHYLLKARGGEGYIPVPAGSAEALTRVRPFDKDRDSIESVSNLFTKMAEASAKEINKDAEEGTKISANEIQKVGGYSAEAYFKLMRKYPHLQNLGRQQVQNRMRDSMGDLFKDIKLWRSDPGKGTEPQAAAIMSYFENKTVDLSSAGITTEDFIGTTGEQLKKTLTDMILKDADRRAANDRANGIKMSGPQKTRDMMDLFRKTWQLFDMNVKNGKETNSSWRALHGAKIEDKKTGGVYSPYMNWIKLILVGNPNDQITLHAKGILQKYSKLI